VIFRGRTLARRVGVDSRCEVGTDSADGLPANTITPPWRIRLKVRVNPGDQTAEFYTLK